MLHPAPSSTRETPNWLGMALVLSAMLSLAASVLLTGVVVWLDLSHSGPVPYGETALRIVVIGGFFLFLGWLMWRVGRSLMSGHHHAVQAGRDGGGAR